MLQPGKSEYVKPFLWGAYVFDVWIDEDTILLERVIYSFSHGPEYVQILVGACQYGTRVRIHSFQIEKKEEN